MLFLSTRLNEKVLLPDERTTIEVVEIQSSNIRLGITASSENTPDVSPTVAVQPDLQAIKGLLDKRLAIARAGITEAREYLRAGNEEDARVVLEKVDEDLFLLRRRLRGELEKADTLTCGI